MWTFLFFLFVILVGGGWLLGKVVGSVLFPSKKENRNVYIDKSVHYHEHKHINIIDDITKKRVFELKESKEVKK